MKELQIFNNEEFGEIRVLEINNTPYFVAVDICKVLEIQNTTQAIQKLDADERTMLNIGRQGETNLVNEYGLYSLILGSRKKEAKEFKRWITHEVLPTLRKEGTYTIRRRHKPIDKAIKQHFNIAETILNATGIKPELAYAVAISEAERETGYSYDEYKKLLPSAKHDVASFNPTKLGERLGGITANQVNLMLERLGLQEKKNGVWRLTEKGKNFGEEKPFSRHDHSDYRIVWHEKVLEVLKENAV